MENPGVGLGYWGTRFPSDQEGGGADSTMPSVADAVQSSNLACVRHFAKVPEMRF